MVGIKSITLNIPTVTLVAVAVASTTFAVSGEFTSIGTTKIAIEEHKREDDAINNVFRADIHVLQVSSALYANDIDHIRQSQIRLETLVRSRNDKLDELIDILTSGHDSIP